MTKSLPEVNEIAATKPSSALQPIVYADPIPARNLQFSESLNTDTASLVPAFHDRATAELLLPHNYPPVVYPTIDSTSSSCLEEQTEKNDQMQVDVPQERVDNQHSTIEEDKDEDASSEVSEGGDLKVCLIFAIKFIIQLIDLITRLTWKMPYRVTLISRATTLLRHPFRKLPTLGCTSMAWDSSDCHSASGTRNLLSDVLRRHPLVMASARLSTPMSETLLRLSRESQLSKSTWDSFVKDLVSRSVWPELGVGPYKTPPRCELYKLLLYRTGSQYVPRFITLDIANSSYF